MSIFKRHDQGNVEQTIATPYPDTGAQGGLPEQPAKPMPAFAYPGVVPPPAAPIYSMRPPESASRVDGSVDDAVADTFRIAREAEQWAQDIAEDVTSNDAPRPRAATPARSVARRSTQRATRPTPRLRHHTCFDPVHAAQTGLLHLAWQWQRAGAPIRAIHAYMELLMRYPHTPAADAAVADLVELSDKLVSEGHFHIAFGIYDQLEELLA